MTENNGVKETLKSFKETNRFLIDTCFKAQQVIDGLQSQFDLEMINEKNLIASLNVLKANLQSIIDDIIIDY